MTPALAVGAAVLGVALAPALARAADALARSRGREENRGRARRLVLYVLLPATLAACAARVGAEPSLAVAVVFVVVGALLAVVDLEHRVVPNDVVLPAAVAGLAARTALDPSWAWAIAAAAAGGFLLVAALASPSGLGMGDVKLGLLLGAVLGRSVVVALVLAFAAVFVASLVTLARHRRAGLKMGLPFAPFLVAGGVAALLVAG